MRYCEYAVDEDNGGQYPGGEYEGKQDAMGMMPMRRRMAGTTQLEERQRVRCGEYDGE